MEPLFRTETEITIEEYKRYCYASFRRNHSLHIFYVLMLVLVAMMLHSLLHRGWLVLVVLPLYALVIYGSLERNIKKNFRSYKGLQEKQTYEFYEDHFGGHAGNNFGEVKYTDLYQIRETKTNFYLYISQRQAHIIVKGNCDEKLIAFLRDLKQQVKKSR